MRAAWAIALFSACACAKGPPPAPPAAEPETRPPPSAAIESVEPTADAAEDVAPATPDAAPAAEDSDASRPAWPPGPLEGSAPSKIGLINLVDERLRKGELASIPDGTSSGRRCGKRRCVGRGPRPRFPVPGWSVGGQPTPVAT